MCGAKGVAGLGSPEGLQGLGSLTIPEPLRHRTIIMGRKFTMKPRLSDPRVMTLTWRTAPWLVAAHASVALGQPKLK